MGINKNHRYIRLTILCISVILWPSNLNSQVLINEIMASNDTVHADLDFGSYCDWIELYNRGDQEVDLSGYFLSDDTANPGMWAFQTGTIIPAHEYLLIYADDSGNGLHTNFKLAKEGEKLLLLDPQSNIIDSLSYPLQKTNVSYGWSEIHQVYGYFESPTPGVENDITIAYGISPHPVFSLEGGFYSGSISIEITTEMPAVSIHYTLDGTEPSQSSAIYVDPISIGQTSVLRAKTFMEGMLDGFVVTNSYFINEPQNLPVFSLVTDPEHLFSDETGIYVVGTAGIPGNCTDVPHNVNQDWERPANIELIEMDGTRALNQMVGVKIFGGCSRVRYPAKSLAFFARKKYESASFDYPLFPDKSSKNYDAFILRTSADDQPFTHFRDALGHMLVKDVINVDYQAYRPAVLYINGEYWGIHNIREKINEHYPETNFGVNPDSVDMLKSNPRKLGHLMAGSPDHYNAMIEYLEENDITQDIHYEYIKTQMEVDEFLNYMITQIFLGGRDWPGTNIKYWRSREEPHMRWRWVLFDLDHFIKDYFINNLELATETDCGCIWPNPPWSTYLLRRMLENESFKHEFIQRYAIYSTTHFSRERVHSFIDKMQADIAPEIPRHIERWGGAKTDIPEFQHGTPIFNSLEEWESNVDVMRNFTDARHELAMKHLNDYFGIDGFARLKAQIKPARGGNLRIGGSRIPDTTFATEFSHGELLSVSCEENPGYKFSHWEIHDPQARDSSLIIQGDQWKYFISETTSSNWTAIDFEDNQWETGQAQLGYGDGDEATVVGFGSNPENKIVTTWFRKSISIDKPSLYERYTLYLLRDDGARVFVNGTEVIRDNMQRYSVGPYARAEDSIVGTDENIWIKFHINPALFKEDNNVIAVEVHLSDVASPDLSFDLELVARSFEYGSTKTIQDKELNLEMTKDREITAVMIPDGSGYGNLFINEIMASNNDNLQDEMGDYEDWLEIYNGGDDIVDIAGLYLTDDLNGPEPWKFPENQPGFTTIQPGGYLVVFADQEMEEGPLHANFKLNKEGEKVFLLEKTGEDPRIIDHLVFDKQSPEASYGRYPDGAPVFEYMTLTTPGTTNSSSVGQESLPPPNNSENSINIYPVPTKGPLYITLSEELSRQNLPVHLKVYSISGKKIYDAQHQATPLITLSLAQHPEGIYLVHITTGNKVSVKQVVVQ